MKVGLPFQINTTVTRLNVDDLGDIYDLVKKSWAPWRGTSSCLCPWEGVKG